MSLTYTAYVSRKIIKFSGIGMVAFFLLWMGVKTSYQLYLKVFPPYSPPTVRYGILPKVIFPEKEVKKKSFEFELANDETPVFLDQSKVYVIYRSSSTILALENDKKTADRLGFSSEPVQIKSGIYEFKNEFNKTLTMNVLDGSFVMVYPYKEDQILLNPVNMPNKSRAIDLASSFLNNGDKLSTSLENGEKKVSYLKVESGTLKPVSSQSEANLAQVDFYRSELDNLDIVSKDVGQASISLLLSGSEVDERRVVEANYKDLNIDEESFSTYPIKSAEEAIEDLKVGAYWPAADIVSNKVIVRDMYLAYFEPVALTNFLQPVFVFEGDNNFTAYVPAVIDDYLK